MQSVATKSIILEIKDLVSELKQFKASIQSQEEAYILEISAQPSVRICGQTAAGVFYGIQSLLSLLDGSSDRRTLHIMTIVDAPRLAYRGLMLDVARNFLTKEYVMKVIDVMAMYKLNRLHLHLTDDQGWRLEVPGLPELTQVT